MCPFSVKPLLKGNVNLFYLQITLLKNKRPEPTVKLGSGLLNYRFIFQTAAILTAVLSTYSAACVKASSSRTTPGTILKTASIP